MGTILTAEERHQLLVRHKGERDGRIKDRIKAVLLRDDGLSYGEIARVLFLTDEGVRQQVADYLQRNGKLEPENGGSTARLTVAQADQLETHLNEKIYVRTSDIAAYVGATFGVTYSISGMTKWLKQHGFSYHKPVGVPAKADGEAVAGVESFNVALPLYRAGRLKVLAVLTPARLTLALEITPIAEIYPGYDLGI
jgi:transposase